MRKFLETLENLSDEPVRRAAQIALAVIDRALTHGVDEKAFDSAYDALVSALVLKEPEQ